MLASSTAKYIVLDIPRLHPRFDLYGSTEFDTESTYMIVTRNAYTKVGRSFMVRFHFYRFGWWRAGVLLMVGERCRRLWNGPMPPCARLDERSSELMRDEMVSPIATESEQPSGAPHPLYY